MWDCSFPVVVNQRPMKILLLEDNSILWKMIVRILKQEGMNVDHIRNGEEGEKFWRIHNKTIDLVLLDLMLPWKNWLEICKNMRSIWVHTPVIVLTAKSEVSEKVLLFRAWVDDYLVKPFDFNELISRILAVLRRPSMVLDEKIILWENILVDLHGRTISIKDVQVEFTAKEFWILEFLIRNKNSVVSQQQIFDSVFDFAKDNWSNTIEVHIKNIRKKLEKHAGTHIIKTIRGAGYKLEI